jgi:putative transcriptional regulator
MRHWLVQFRKAKNLTQREVAELAGISRSYYGDIEQGTKGASGKAAKKISVVLGFPMDLFFADDGLKTSQNKSA